MRVNSNLIYAFVVYAYELMALTDVIPVVQSISRDNTDVSVMRI